MKAGAVEFLVKPFSNDVLQGAIRESIERSRAALDGEMAMRDLRNCYASLTPRERQVMALVVSGLLNKQVGGNWASGEITVKAHRRAGHAKDEGEFPRQPGEDGYQAPTLASVNPAPPKHCRSPLSMPPGC
jgi:FixJ family two-component response regulator